VYDKRTGTKVRETFSGKGALAAAKAWRSDATSMQNQGKKIGKSTMTLREAAEAWLAGAEAEPPTVLTRGGRPYKPNVVREYRRALHSFVLDDLGAQRLSDIRRGDLQALVDRLAGAGKSGSTIRNVLMPIRVIYRHALERDQVAVNPTQNLRLPNGHKPRDRAATVTEAADLLAALPHDDRALWAAAFYAGLRRGELRAIRWEDIDLATGTIRVHRGWDDVAGEIAPKSEKGNRSVPINDLLHDYLTELKARTGRDGTDFVFGPKRDRPFTPSYIRKRANAAWAAANENRTKKKLPPLVPIGLHECRHTFVSIMHDAGVSLEVIGDLVGHSSVYMTDRYRHLLAGAERDAVRRLNEYIALANSHSRIEQLEGAG
jgi:integrase